MSHSLPFSFLAAALLLPLLRAQVAPPERHHLAEVSLLDDLSLRAATEAGVALDCQSRLPGGLAEITVSDRQLAEMRRLGARVRIKQADLEEFYAGRIAADAEPPRLQPGIQWDSGSMGGYFTLAEMEQILDQLTTAHPAICTPKFSIGTSVEGRDLWAVKVSDNPQVDEDEPEHRIDSLHHAREPISMVTTLFFLEWLLVGYGVDPLATHLVNEREVWLIPAVNPDGYEYNRQIAPNGGGLWRKNRRDNGGGSFGVDLNRNYSFQWGYDNSGSSNNKDSETYRGTGPTSEPETQAMEAFISARSFRTANSAHTYSDLWLFPWGYTCSDPPQLGEFETIAEWFTAENGYVSGPICQTLYDANGDTVDYDFGVHGTWSGTIEIGGGGDGFWPSTSRIVPLLEENLRAYQRLALYAAAGLEADGWDWTESVGDGDPWYEPGEEFELAVLLTNAGTLPTAGSATLAVTSDHADVEVLDGAHDFGTVAAFGAADNQGAPLRIRVAAGASAGRRVVVRAELAYDGYAESHEWSLVLGVPTSLDEDDIETDLGWVLGASGDDAATGRWEIADPQQTTSGGNTCQPADDHSPGGTRCCVTDGRAGSSAGTYDVDDGVTTVMSPQFDLEDAASPIVSYWRWFTDLTQDDDELLVEISADDGATWAEVERVQSNDNAWRQVLFDASALVAPSDRMRLRWRVADDPNNSLAEALVDDLGFQGFPATGVSLWRYGTPRTGGTIRLHVQGDANRSFALFAALAGNSADLGDLGIWELDWATMLLLFGASTGSTGRFTTSGQIPNDPALIGQDLHLQTLVFDPAGSYVSNAVDFVIQ